MGLMDFFKLILLQLVSEECFDRFFIEFDFFDASCFKSTLSKLLGFGIVLGSCLIKLPQIMKIINAKSGFGISLASVSLDLTAITLSTSYNYIKQFPFSAWGENAFLSIQTAVVGFLILFYNRTASKAYLYFATYLIISYILMSGFTPIRVLWLLQFLNIPIVLMGKSSQAYANYKNQSTGQLSAITVFLMFFGSLARVFTSIQETGDAMLILTYMTSSFVNTIIAFQMVYYWNCLRIPIKKYE